MIKGRVSKAAVDYLYEEIEIHLDVNDLIEIDKSEKGCFLTRDIRGGFSQSFGKGKSKFVESNTGYVTQAISEECYQKLKSLLKINRQSRR